MTRGPKATGAVRAAGLHEAWSPASEAMGELLERLLAGGVGRRRSTVALQEHGEPMPEFARALERAGASVIEVAVGRLRGALGPAAGAVQTVVKRGYRLAVDSQP